MISASEFSLFCVAVSNIWLASDSPRGKFWGGMYLALGVGNFVVYVLSGVA